ncbi:hypothetical protein AMECASPLE_001195 [Ameca splendens]|uniref:Uncharacterized protein n=1 Tax=Ameca splendens TaxID=208324 RepID=A0ABV1A495_9TELE
MSYTHSHSPYTLYTPRSRYRYPRGAIAPWIQEVFPSFRGEDRQTVPAAAQTSAGTARTQQPRHRPRPPALTPVPNDPGPHPEREPLTKEGPTWSKRARQPELSQDETVPTPQ